MNKGSHLLPLSGIALALVICVVWGGNYTAAATGMQHFSPFLFMILRFILLFVLLVPFLRRPPPGQWGRLIAVCLFFMLPVLLTVVFSFTNMSTSTGIKGGDYLISQGQLDRLESAGVSAGAIRQ